MLVLIRLRFNIQAAVFPHPAGIRILARKCARHPADMAYRDGGLHDGEWCNPNRERLVHSNLRDIEQG